jgi:disulfide bond formation protein DsbB
VKARQWVQTQTFWLLGIALGLMLEGTALFYQYALNELPCTLCIQFRVLVLGLILFATVGLFLRRQRMALMVVSLFLLLIFIQMFYVSYELLGTERGFILGDCSIESPFPAWFALDQWIPWLFEVQTTCGYTPIIAFGITMAESLMALSIVLILLALWMLFVLNRRASQED